MRIDTHHHIVPPFYADWLKTLGINAGGRAIPEWRPESALELMASLKVETSILSVSTPGVSVSDLQTGRAMARRVNEYAAQVCADHPGRFGFFATLTLPDVEGAITEAKHALDVLQADGVILLSNTRGVYLGDGSLTPLMEELNQRSAVVFVHPSSLPAPEVPGIPPYVADFLLDTTRAAIHIAQAGWLQRFSQAKFILSHGGGFLPYAAARVARACAPTDAEGIALLRKFYFDTALTSSPYAMPSLLAFADPGHITFGSDWPFAPRERSEHFAGMLDSHELTAAQRTAIDRGNALSLFPRLSKPLG